MWNGVNNFNFYNFGENPFVGVNLTGKQYNNAIDEAIYSSDEFRMFAYKINRCTRVRPHDWTTCPYAHRNEKAQRRDPRKVPYCAISCPAFKNGKCPKEDSCQFSHGVFEYWLHPARYRTRVCNAGPFCRRKVCFFAHTEEELRPEPRPRCHFVYAGKMSGGDYQYHQQQRYIQYTQDDSHDVTGSGGSSSGGHEESVNVTSGMVPESPSSAPPMWGDWGEYRYEEVEEVLKSFRGLEIGDNGRSHSGDEQVKKSGHVCGGVGGIEVPDSDLPHVTWIVDLLQ